MTSINQVLHYKNDESTRKLYMTDLELKPIKGNFQFKLNSNLYFPPQKEVRT